MIRIAICDDEEIICSVIEKYLLLACSKLHIESEIDIFVTGSMLKNHLRNGNVYDIFFLDILLKDDTGISISNCIRNEIMDESAQIIYVSGKTGYDRQLFEFRPFSFIEKPFSAEIIHNTLEKYIRIYGNKSNLFYYKYGHDTYSVNLRDVLYFKSNRKLIDIIMLSSHHEFYGKMNSIIDNLSQYDFISPHKSYIINHQYIRTYQANAIIMVNGDEIPISKRKKDGMFKTILPNSRKNGII